MVVPRDQVVLDLMQVLLGNVRRKHAVGGRRSALVTPRVYLQPRSQPGRLADGDDSGNVSDPVYAGRIRHSEFIKLLSIRPVKPH